MKKEYFKTTIGRVLTIVVEFDRYRWTSRPATHEGHIALCNVLTPGFCPLEGFEGVIGSYTILKRGI